MTILQPVLFEGSFEKLVWGPGGGGGAAQQRVQQRTKKKGNGGLGKKRIYRDRL